MQNCGAAVSAAIQHRRFTAVTQAKPRPGFPTPYKDLEGLRSYNVTKVGSFNALTL
jgi:hypothetical protein